MFLWGIPLFDILVDLGVAALVALGYAKGSQLPAPGDTFPRPGSGPALGYPAAPQTADQRIYRQGGAWDASNGADSANNPGGWG